MDAQTFRTTSANPIARTRGYATEPPLQRFLAECHEEFRSDNSGAVADYIPQLALADPDDRGERREGLPVHLAGAHEERARREEPGVGAEQDGAGTAPLPNDLQAWLDHQERDILIRALKETGFNRTATAARLGISLRQMRYRMARLAIATPSSGPDHDE